MPRSCLPPLIFLDIDGVLAHFGSNDKLDSNCISLLDALIDATNAIVVLTSAWRHRYGLAETQHRLAAAGFRGQLTGAVPTLVGRSRSHEIRQYLSATNNRRAFVILDDVPPEADLLSRFVAVDDFEGLTPERALIAARLLRRRT